MDETQPRLWTKNFIGISSTNFFLFLNFYLLLTTLPMYAIEELGASTSTAGLLTTAYLLSAIIARPFAGIAIEKFGGKPLLVLSLFIFLGTTILYFLTSDIVGLLAIRLIQGIGFGVATTATGAIVAGIVPKKRRGEGMGYFVLSSNLAMVLGPFLGLTAMQTGSVTVMLILAFAASIIGLLSGILVKIKKAPVDLNQPTKQAKFNFHMLFEVSAIPIAITGAFFAIIYSSILSFISVYANELNLGNAASYFFVVYAVVLLLSRPFTGKWYDRYGANAIVFPCIVLFGIGLFILSDANTAVLFLVAAGLIGLGWGTLFPTFQTIAIQSASPKRAAMATATFLSIYDIGVALGSFVIGGIASVISFSEMYLYSAFYVLAGLGVYYLLHVVRTRKKEQEEHAGHPLDVS